MRVVQYGGLGAFSTVSLRGAPAGQVAVYLDGVPLTSAAHGVVNLADLPVTAIERIEVYRGLSAARARARRRRAARSTWSRAPTPDACGSCARARLVRHLGGARHLAAARAGRWSRAAPRRLPGLATATSATSTTTARRSTPTTTAMQRAGQQPLRRVPRCSARSAGEPARRHARARCAQDLFRKRAGRARARRRAGARTRGSSSSARSRRLELGASRRARLAALRARGSWRARAHRASATRAPSSALGTPRHRRPLRRASTRRSGSSWPRLPLGVVARGRRLAAARGARELDDAADGARRSAARAARPRGGAGRRCSCAAARRARCCCTPARRWDRLEDRLRSTGDRRHRRAQRRARASWTRRSSACASRPRAGLELRANWSRRGARARLRRAVRQPGQRARQPGAACRSAARTGTPARAGRARRRRLRGPVEWAHYESRTRAT